MEKIKEQRLAICDDCQQAIIAGTLQNDPVLQEHLKNCEECRSFAAFYSEMLSTEPAMPVVQLPEFAELKAKAHQQREASSRFLRLVVVPMSAAAAFVLAVGGVFFHTHLEKKVSNPVVMPEKQAVKTLNNPSVQVAVVNVQNNRVDLPEDLSVIFADDEAFAAALEENTVTLAWDVTSRQEAQCRDSMTAARSNTDWSIDYFNPYNEE